jgi:hypothetical protein
MASDALIYFPHKNVAEPRSRRAHTRVSPLSLATRSYDNRPAQFQLIEAGRGRQRLLKHQAGRIACNRIEAELHLRVRILVVPCGPVFVQGHAEVGLMGDLRGIHIAKDVVQRSVAYFSKNSVSTAG